MGRIALNIKKIVDLDETGECYGCFRVETNDPDLDEFVYPKSQFNNRAELVQEIVKKIKEHKYRKLKLKAKWDKVKDNARD